MANLQIQQNRLDQTMPGNILQSKNGGRIAAMANNKLYLGPATFTRNVNNSSKKVMAIKKRASGSNNG